MLHSSMSLVENFLLGDGFGSAGGVDPENMSDDTLDKGENVIGVLLGGCRLSFVKSVLFSTLVGDGRGNLTGEYIFLN